MPNPYEAMPERAFWRSAVAEVGPFGITDVYRSKFAISGSDRVSTAGSCFAQHIGQRLAGSGFGYQDFEPAPSFLPSNLRRQYGYGVYSARYANIYTARQLLQLLLRAFGDFTPKEDHWEQNGRFYDPFRPAIEPDGFSSLDVLRTVRDSHFRAVRRLFEETDVFIFTFGLTEAWLSAEDGAVFPVCPGTAAGVFDPVLHVFRNFSYEDIYVDLMEFIARVRSINPGIRLLFTVSPVPLIATATDAHVLSATSYSKSVLRAVAGRLQEADDNIDYFPSYELISGFQSRAMFYEPNLRGVAGAGVDFVMQHFFREHAPPAASPPIQSALEEGERTELELVCEEDYIHDGE